MKYFKVARQYKDFTGELAINNMESQYIKQRRIVCYNKLTLESNSHGESLSGESNYYSKQYLEKHPLERRTLELQDKESKEVYKSVSVHSRLTRQQKKRMGIIPSVRCL